MEHDQLWAHSENRLGVPQPLAQHLEQTRKLAAGFATAWGGEAVATAAALLHDLGKVSPQFQQYVRGRAGRGGDHSTLGAVLCPQDAGPVPPFLVAGHHAGLPDLRDLMSRLRGWAAEPPAAVDRLAREVLEALGRDLSADAPAFAGSDSLEAEFLIRMVFSALVDADYLDTERHFGAEKADARACWPATAELLKRFERSQAALLTGAPDTPLNSLRRSIYRQCVEAADCPQGVFSLTVPTGGGKTLSGMGFALAHATRHQLERVIVVIPFTSIIEQTADVYRRALGADAVLEHHSAVAWEEVEDTERQRWALAAENWDAPVVVTTSVQFFESLFSNRPSMCRKLHNIANSVVIIDEVQTLPTQILEPSFRVLSSLVRNYGTSVVLCTATQPAYSQILSSADSPGICEIVSDLEQLFEQLRRVEYQLGRDGSLTMGWDEAAAAMRAEDQAMAVLNTRGDARALFERLPADSRFHLSTSLCGAHRRQVLEEVRRRLADGSACHLATTQLVEAGVDIDFPIVLRAVGPLDRIVQAAGRCNREGRLPSGRVVIFEPPEGKMPPGPYCVGAGTARTMLGQIQPSDLHRPEVYTRYFSMLYHGVDLDEYKITRDRKHLLFATVARNYHVIGEDTVSVAVPWKAGRDLLSGIEARQDDLTRDDLRSLQPYFVSLQRWQHRKAEQAGLCREVAPGLWRWEGIYDDELGLLIEADGVPFQQA